MRAELRLGLGQLVVFVTVAVVLNAQFTWWVVYSLRENRERLDLERAVILAQAESAALRLADQAEEAARRLVAVAPGVIPTAAEPFTEVTVIDGKGAQASGWIQEGSRVAFASPLGHNRSALAYLDPDTPRRWLAAIDPSLRLLERGEGHLDLPRVGIPPPFDRLAVAPDLNRWGEMLARYRRRVVMVVGEGSFFLAAMITVVVLLYTMLRRESALEREHQSFVSAVTHELKTPLAGIRLALETVLKGRVDAEGSTRFLSNALADAERLNDLVQKVLEVTRYAGGGHRLRVVLGDLSELAQEEVVAAERRAAARGTALESDIEAGIQAPFDPEALGIVISNLIENALKYAQGDPPRVAVRLRVLRGEAVLEVQDNGVGIATSDLESIFEPFYRASDEVTRRTPGTGIGLFVAREIVTAHGGRLLASSDGRGKGSTFKLFLPGANIIADEELTEYISSEEAR